MKKVEIDNYSYKGIEGIVPPNRIARWVVDRLGSHFIKEIDIEGSENFKKAQEMARMNRTGIIFASRHGTNADYPVHREALRENGVTDEDVNTVPVLGLRLYENRFTRFASKTTPHILVWPPTEEPKDEEEAKYAQSLNLRALKTQKKVLDNGMNILIFPQGGREAGPITRIPKPQISGFLEHGVVLPMGILADKVLPKGRIVPVRNSVTVVYGNPVLGSHLKEMFQDLPKQERRQAVVDYVMVEIARLMPPYYRGAYAEKVMEVLKKSPSQT